MVKPGKSSPLGSRRLRRRSRRSERGAAVFIVVMAIVLLTGIGVFAVRTASMVDMAAGYDRQAMQAHHLSELAGRTAASDTSGVKEIVQLMLNKRGSPSEPCAANRNRTDLGCYRIDHGRFAQRVTAESTGNALLATQGATTDGSFGPRLGAADGRAATLEGQILVELTDPNNRIAPGEDASKETGLEVTVTAHAQVRPTGADVDRPWCTAEVSSTGASVQLLRTHLTITK